MPCPKSGDAEMSIVQGEHGSITSDILEKDLLNKCCLIVSSSIWHGFKKGNVN